MPMNIIWYPGCINQWQSRNQEKKIEWITIKSGAFRGLLRAELTIILQTWKRLQLFMKLSGASGTAQWTMLNRKKTLCLLSLKEVICSAMETATAFSMQQGDYFCSAGWAAFRSFFHNLSDLICFRNGTAVLCFRCRQKTLKRQASSYLWWDIREGEASASIG